MASPLSADRFLAALLAEGVRVQEHPGWRTHNRNHKGPWGPVHGVMLHHTAGTNSLRTCIEGQSSEVPGPLCLGLIDKDGIVHLIGYGRTNHAGKGSAAVLAAVKAESALPRPGADEVDGTVHFYGFEIENLGNGRDPYPAAQLDTSERIAAAICRAHGWTAASTIGHGEWTRRKIDPSFSMPEMRGRIAARLGAKPQPTDPPKPPAGKPSVSLSKLIAAAKADPPKAGTPVSYAGTKTVEAALVAEGLLSSALADGHFGTATVRAFAKWQRRYSERRSLGWTSADCDGIPGRTSLTALGAAHGFTVTN